MSSKVQEEKQVDGKQNAKEELETAPSSPEGSEDKNN